MRETAMRRRDFRLKFRKERVMPAEAGDPRLGFLVKLAGGLALVVVLLVFIGAEVIEEHTQTVTARGQHGQT
jgi:hypothetical protein